MSSPGLNRPLWSLCRASKNIFYLVIPFAFPELACKRDFPLRDNRQGSSSTFFQKTTSTATALAAGVGALLWSTDKPEVSSLGSLSTTGQRCWDFPLFARARGTDHFLWNGSAVASWVSSARTHRRTTLSIISSKARTSALLPLTRTKNLSAVCVRCRETTVALILMRCPGLSILQNRGYDSAGIATVDPSLSSAPMLWTATRHLLSVSLLVC